MQRPQKPLLRWAGSKSLLIPELLNRCKKLKFNQYFEPFVGSGALFFALAPKKALISDINAELVNFYRVLKHSPLKLYNHVIGLPIGEESYYEIRSQLPKELDSLERAGRFLFLNRFCFNGIYRANSHGHFNVPFGIKTGGIPPYRAFQKASKTLQVTELKNSDFQEICSIAKRRDLVYLDPPYDYTQRRDRGEYGPDSFRLPDLIRLDESLRRLNKTGTTFLLSYLNVPEITNIARSYYSIDFKVKRQVAAFADKRTSISELLISNSKSITIS